MGIKQEETGLKIVAIDIETTGLSGKRYEKNNSDLLEIGIVLYDVKEYKGLSYKELDKIVPKIRIIVHRPTKNLQGGFFAFNMHHDTLMPLHQEIDKKGKTEVSQELEVSLKLNETLIICTPDEVIHKILYSLLEHGWISHDEVDKGNLKNAITVAGKNVSGFDIPYLKDYIKDFAWRLKSRVRVYDPTVFFANEDMDRLPSLDECLDMAREYNYDFPKGVVSHTAVEDSMDVVNLIHLSYQRGLHLKNKMKHTSSKNIGADIANNSGADKDRYD